MPLLPTPGGKLAETLQTNCTNAPDFGCNVPPR
jgi:hypothetical protein